MLPHLISYTLRPHIPGFRHVRLHKSREIKDSVEKRTHAVRRASRRCVWVSHNAWPRGRRRRPRSRRSIIPVPSETGREALRQSQTWNPEKRQLRATEPSCFWKFESPVAAFAELTWRTWLNVTGGDKTNGSCSPAQTFRMFTLPLIQTLTLCIYLQKIKQLAHLSVDAVKSVWGYCFIVRHPGDKNPISPACWDSN